MLIISSDLFRINSTLIRIASIIPNSGWLYSAIVCKWNNCGNLSVVSLHVFIHHLFYVLMANLQFYNETDGFIKPYDEASVSFLHNLGIIKVRDIFSWLS